jgi:superfamily II DNA or RNA helicase
MFLSLPYVLGVDESPAKNMLRQIAEGARTVNGTLSNFTTDRLRGWLFEPAGLGDKILVVPPTTKPARVPAGYARVLCAEIHDTAAQRIDLTGADWLRHPKLGTRTEHEDVLDSWGGAFSYLEEDPDRNVVGLRPAQIGAVHAVHAHWSVAETPATIVMPTGTGKTETMLSVLVSARCPRVLVVVPTDALRTQIAEKFLTLGVLKMQGASLLNESAAYPTVCVLRHIPKTVADAAALLEPSHVIVTTSSIAGQCPPEVQEIMAVKCTHLFIDEAHHAEAPTWSDFKARFSVRRVLQFTATPFREDGRPLDGKLIYVYPLRKAQAEGYFTPIKFVNVIEFDRRRADKAIAAAAVTQLRADSDKGHILMARVDTVGRAETVFQIYQQYLEFNPVQLHTGMSSKAREESRRKILRKQSRIVVCVDMLGEGFDLPELKIAAFHDIRKTLSVTLQLAGRFTRARLDLGNATFIANTADVSVRDELRKLYAREPDWNVLLPQLSDAMIGEQQSMQDFLRGFTSFVDEIPLKTVRPALSTVVYTTRCVNWVPENARQGIPNVGSCEQVHVATNEAEHTIIVVTARRVELAWTEVESLFSWQWELYVIYWWRERSLLFINGSTNAGEFKSLAQAVAGEDVDLIRGQDVFRSFAGVTRLRLSSVGLSEQLGRNVSFTNRMGADVAPVLLDTHLRRARKSVLAGSGYEGGESTTVGASRKGRIWSHRRDRVDQLVTWCRHVGAKLLDSTIHPDTVLRGTLETTIVSTRPSGMPIGVDWPEEIYTSSETPWSVSIGDRTRHISETDLEIAEPTLAGPIRFALIAEDARAEFELEFLQRGDTWDFRFVQCTGEPVRVIRAETPFSASDFFSENPPRVWFADGASLDGNEYTPLKSDLPPYDPERIEAWNWAGINLRKESRGDTKDPESIQAAVIARLSAGDYHVIFDDDDTGEAADVVTVRLVGGIEAPTRIDVELYHCKYSSEDAAGARIADLYVVCGQAQTSARWMSSPGKRTDLFTHLLRREAQRASVGRPTRFEQGDPELVATLREMTYTTPVTLRIIVVQPGVSRARISDSQLRLLSVTENYLMETYQLPFLVIASE